jgi:hypothetical protein
MNTELSSSLLWLATASLIGLLSACGGGSSEDEVPQRSFITWTNSVNGTTVKDAQNERFAFYTDTRCLYSYNMKQETSNFCLTTGANGNFAGTAVRVILAASTSGGECLAVLAAPDGRQVDIYTNAGVQTVAVRSTRWNTTGC